MPYAPPPGDKCHAADFQFRGENSLIEEQYKTQAAVLYACFDGDGSP